MCNQHTIIQSEEDIKMSVYIDAAKRKDAWEKIKSNRSADEYISKNRQSVNETLDRRDPWSPPPK